jgi:prenyltransferase beta subunit
MKQLPLLSWYGGVYRYLLETKKANQRQLHEMAKKITSFQRSDGGFQMETKGTSSSVVETTIAVDFLLDIGIQHDSSTISRAIDFLLTQQQKDGGFVENANVKHPIEWDDKYIYEKRISTPHITAWVLKSLLKIGLPKETPAIAKALKYLAVSQKRDGGWSHFKSEPKSSIHFTALILIALGKFEEFEQAINVESLDNFFIAYQKANASIGDCLDASLLVAEAWFSLGKSMENPNMRGLVDWIVKQQSPDGSFMDKDCGWPDTLENRVVSSMNVSRVLHKIGYTP